MPDTDVVVVGAGPVGLATALGLARAGIRSVVLDKDAGLNTSPRAMAHLYPVLPGLDGLGVLDDMKAIGLVGPGINFIDMASGEHFPQRLSVLQGLVPHPYALQLGQGDVGTVLLQHLTSYSGTEVRWNSRVTEVANQEAGVAVNYETPDGTGVIRAGWLVAADGSSSTVRDLLGLPFDGFTWPDRFVSTNIRHDFSGHGLPSANWRIDSEHGAVIARIDQSDLWRYTFREPGDLPLEGLEERIHEHFEGGLYGGEYELVQFAPYRMHQRCVDSFRHGRVVLAGDAAHITNPIGGLGLSGGLLDAFVLYEALAAVIDGKVDDSILDVYSERRKQVWTDVVSPTASRLKRMLFDPPPPGEPRAEILAELRATAHDDDLLREDLLRQGAIATPSILPAGSSPE